MVSGIYMLEYLLRRFKPRLQYCRYLVTQSQVDVANRAKVATTNKMYAWQIHSYGELSELRLDEARVPSLRGPDEILVRVHASSINPLDIAMIGGYGSRIFNTLRTLEGVGAKEGVEFPLVLGRDFCGVVERAGPDAVDRLSPGTLVWGVVPPHWPGAHAEYVVVKEKWAGPAPRALSELEAGGALYAALTARAGLLVAGLGVRKNEARRARVLLLGVGGVGSAALQLLVHSGAEVIVGCSRDAAEGARALGAVAVLERDDPSYDHELVAAGPYEVILDCAGLGGDEAARRSWRYGRYVTFTSPLLRRTDALGVLAGTGGSLADWVVQTAAAVRASAAPLGACPPPHVRWAYFTPSASGIDQLACMADGGQFRVTVQSSWPWAEAAAAYELAARGHLRGKVVVDFAADSAFTKSSSVSSSDRTHDKQILSAEKL